MPGKAIIGAALSVVIGASGVGAQLRFGDVSAVIELQRAADAYAFLHRQVERRLGMAHRSIAAPDSEAMAAAIREARGGATQGTLFTPAASAALREALGRASSTPGCDLTGMRGAGTVTVNGPASATRALPECALRLLPRLPEELEFRAAAGALVLVDGHANLVVDVLPGALAGTENR